MFETRHKILKSQNGGVTKAVITDRKEGTTTSVEAEKLEVYQKWNGDLTYKAQGEYQFLHLAFAEGDRVNHSTFGPGVIIRISFNRKQE